MTGDSPTFAAICARVLRDPKVATLSMAERGTCADAIDALTARVAQLEACLTDTVQQLELGGVTE